MNLFLIFLKGDLAALGNINSLHSLLAAGPLLLSQAPSLGMSLPQNQAALNPLTCLQVTHYLQTLIQKLVLVRFLCFYFNIKMLNVNFLPLIYTIK